MSKQKIIECIQELNITAKIDFLEGFSMEDLDTYLEHLLEVNLEKLAICA